MIPPISYMGGKRRLLKRLRPLLDPESITLYAEPFAGMGAAYLDLRARGYRGPAILADSLEDVRRFWVAIHDATKAQALLEAARGLQGIPRTLASYKLLAESPVSDEASRAARFLFLTQFGFGSKPARYVASEGRWRTAGCGRVFGERVGRWEGVIERLETLAEGLVGQPTTIEADGIDLLSRLPETATVYADPPYSKTTSYEGGKVGIDYITPTLTTRARVILSESLDIRDRLPEGWSYDTGHVARNVSDGGGSGTRQVEIIYTS